MFEASFIPRFKCLSSSLGAAVPPSWQAGATEQIKLLTQSFRCCRSISWSKGKVVVNIIKPPKRETKTLLNWVGSWIPETD